MEENSMKRKAYAKINISLDVVGKREDNYHLLKMIMQNIELYDEIDIKKIKEGITIKEIEVLTLDEKGKIYMQKRNEKFKILTDFKENKIC